MKTILVVEDECDVRENLEVLLESEGYNVLCARDGIEAYKIAFAKEPDLILSDIRMPRMDGFKLVEKLQRNQVTNLIPFIFLTAKSEIDDIRAGMNKGADDYILKPFTIDEVLSSIKTRLLKSEKHSSNIKEFKNLVIKKLPHELRTPLVGILGMSEIILEDIDQMPKSEIKEIVNKIKFSGNRLHRRIEKFLTYTLLLEMNQNHLSEGDAADIEYNINAEIIKKKLFEKAKEFNRADDLDVIFENGKLKIYEWQFEILLDELIENSLKYSKQGSDIIVIGKPDGQNYVIKILDKGKGIKNLDFNNIKAFNQFGEEDGTEEGIGIGLVIVKKIIEITDGYLTFQNHQKNNNKIELGIPLININGK